jgi:16S rRNA (adenine1518-N6/adenine1519-N6)-dimethyltransferase
VPRQTVSYLRGLFARRGISPQHRHGQNFLIDLNLHDVIVREAALTADDVVLEVGPGAGALTSRLAREAAAVIAVEIDPAMAGLTAEATREFSNVQVLNRDALGGKHAIDPVVLDHVRAELAAGAGRRFKLVANLPYHVATPLIVNLWYEVGPDLSPVCMVVTIQKEVADRLVAEPGSNEYGSLTALVGAVADVEVLRVLPPSVFWPRPKIDSAIVRIDANPEKRALIDDLGWYHEVVRRLFLLRRKHVRGAVHAQWGDRLSKQEVDAILESIDVPGQVRAEALNVAELNDLASALKAGLFPDEPDGAAR